MGNAKVERAKLSAGFIPLGVKEYGGVIYIASYNPDTNECEIGSFPSPERDITGIKTIENQTGLVDGSFLTEDFTLATQKVNGEFLPEEVLFKVQKLNEPEVLKLNPGDKFITTYRINPIMNSDVNEGNFESYFSSDPNNKAIFQIKFYKIGSDNNIIEMDPADVKSIPYREDIEEDEYTYYVESNGGALGVGVELNTITYFNSNVREISKRADQDKKIRIEALGEVDSLIEFEGIRVDIVKNEDDPSQENLTFHIRKENDSTNKVSGSVTDLQESDKLKVDVTPFCQFGYFPNMMQSFNLQMGVNLNGSNLNNIFRWYVRENVNRLELDFDFTQEVEGNAKMFVEFYDPWSNVSTFKVIQNPSIYSTMNVIVNLIDDPKTAIFDPYPTSGPIVATNQKGGILFNKLNPYNGEVMDPILINTSLDNGVKLIRNDDALRKNHFYIVRICLYEEVDDNAGGIKRTFYNYYKALYTNTAYNSLYVEQQSIANTDVNYKPDFTNVPYPLEKIQFSGSLSKTLPHTLTSTVQDYSSIPTTNYKGNDQLFSMSERPSGNYLTINTNHNIKKSYELKLDKKSNMYYGRLKSNLLDIESEFTEDVSNKIISNSNANNPIVSNGVLKFKKINDTSATVELDFDTTRPARGLIVQSEEGVVEKKTYLTEYMYKPNTEVFAPSGSLVTPWQTSALGLSRARVNEGNTNEASDIGSDNGIAIVMRILDETNWGSNTKDSVLKVNGVEWKVENNETRLADVTNSADVLMSSGIPSKTQFFSTVLNVFFYSGNTPNMRRDVQLVKSNGSLALTENHLTGLTFFSRNPVNPRLLFIPINGSATVEYFNRLIKTILGSLYHVTIEQDPDAIGYYINNNFEYYTNEPTNIQDLSISVKTIWNLPSVKTYISEALYGTPTYKDFSTDEINTLISNAIANNPSQNHLNSGLLDNEFIPYVTPTTVIKDYTNDIPLGDFTITLSTDELVKYLYTNSKELHDLYVQEMTSIDADYLQKIHIEQTIITNMTLKMTIDTMASLLRYNPDAQEGSKIEVIDSSGNFNLKLAARTASGKPFRIGIYNAYNTPLTVNSSPFGF